MYRTVVLVISVTSIGYFRADQPPILACGATRIRFFLVPGAEAFKHYNPNAEVHLYDTSHFALETHYPEIAGAIRDSCSHKLAAQVRAA
jgi:hypothetical protein